VSTADTMRALTRPIKTAPLPVLYEQAKSQLAKLATVDECKDWADKAAALASYARQAQDDELLKAATRIRARAIARCGELLKEREPAKGGQTKKGAPGSAPSPVSRASMATAAGLSSHQAKQALRVASVPPAEREALIENDDPPTVTALADRGKRPAPKPLMDLEGRDPKEFNRAILIIGELSRLEEMIVQVSPSAFLRGCLPRHMRPLRDSSRKVVNWLERVMEKAQ
jgi:hypothetical protein